MEPSSPLLYIKEEEPEDDETLYCEQCRSFYINKCEVHGPTLFIPDTPVPVGVTDRARKTLPAGLEVLQSDIPDAGLGVFNNRDTLPVGAHFGPYQGELVDEEEAMTSGFSWVIYRSGQCEEYIDARRETHANWMRYVNCARNDEEQNLVAFQYRGEIFYRCCRPIEPGQELLMWYNDEYAKNLSMMFNNFWNKKSNTNAQEMSDSMLEVFSCSLCPISFTSQNYLQSHIRRFHREEDEALLHTRSSDPQRSPSDAPHSDPTRGRKRDRIHPCPECGKSFTHRSALQAHQRIHTGEKPYHCSTCGKSFVQKIHLLEHQRVHTRVKPYECPHCGKSFTKQGHLQRHERIHTGERPYHCSECERSFGDIGTLIKHQRTHTGEKPYYCALCGRSFTRQCTLQRHQLVHTGQKPYQCSVCEKSFTQRGSLMKHQSIHTGEKPYHCLFCEKRFSQKASLLKHQQLHTRDDPHRCSDRGWSFTTGVPDTPECTDLQPPPDDL